MRSGEDHANSAGQASSIFISMPLTQESFPNPQKTNTSKNVLGFQAWMLNYSFQQLECVSLSSLCFLAMSLPYTFS